MKTKPTIHLIILFAAILIALIFQIQTILRLTELIIDGEPITGIWWDKSIWFFLISILSFYCTAVFNISWKSKIFTSHRFGRFNPFLISLANILLLIGLSVIGSLTHKLFFQESILVYHMALKILVIFIFAVLISYILVLIGKARAAELDNARLKEEKAKAELASLKEQISPHFLFNTLSSLSSLIRSENKNTSLEFIDKMSQVYRYILESNQNDVVKLKDEIEFLHAYFFLLGKRFGHKIVLDIDMSPDAHDTFIPPMALQLLVENAIQHNTVTDSNPLTIKVYDMDQHICVRNNFNPKASSENFGIGLANLMKRYQLIANKDIIIHKSSDSFLVNLPMIK